ncbi:MAG: serine/threonine protein kinase [Deltaproteobacteria bacterium]|nr:serine/threonine protein kinase [Deltaproteobacteria bacterium]
MTAQNQLDLLKRSPELSGRFEFVRLLGHGTAGNVYLVKDRTRPEQYLALKLLTNDMAFDEHTITRFREEWAVCQRIKHPNLVQSYDLIEYDKCLAFTMEYVQGFDLARLLRQEKFSYDEVNRIMYQLLEAVHALHELNVMHRDIKLENIFLRKDGVIKLGDLGLLKKIGVKNLTRPGILLGTPQYMPPEYIRAGRFDFRSDVYACGVVMYELLTGKRRLDDKRGAAAITYLIKTKFEFPRIALSGDGRKYVKILERALAVNPSKRFTSAKEMQEAFSPRTLERPETFSQSPSVTFHFGGGTSHAIKKLKKIAAGVSLLAVFAMGLAVAWYFLGLNR